MIDTVLESISGVPPPPAREGAPGLRLLYKKSSAAFSNNSSIRQSNPCFCFFLQKLYYSAFIIIRFFFFFFLIYLLRNQNIIQSLQVNIMVSYKNYVTNYNIYTWLEWLGGGGGNRSYQVSLANVKCSDFKLYFVLNIIFSIIIGSFLRMKQSWKGP